RALARAVRRVPVVPEAGDTADRTTHQLARERLGLLRLAGLGEVAGDQQHVGLVRDRAQLLAQGAGRVRPDVQVADSGHADHSTVSIPSASGNRTTLVRFSTSRSGQHSCTTSVTDRRRSALGPGPWTATPPPPTTWT